MLEILLLKFGCVFVQFLQKFFDSETRYLSDLTTLVEVYYRQFRIAVNSGHVTLRREQLDAIFLNWYVIKSILAFEYRYNVANLHGD